MKFNFKRNYILISSFLFIINGFGQLYDFDSHTFTNAGAEGKDGPTLAECQRAYKAESWGLDPTLFNMTTQGVQEWTVPKTGDYQIEAYGAQGGDDLYTSGSEDGGLGAKMVGTFSLTEGDVLYILVGQKGGDTRVTSTDNAGPGGGGGTYVWDPNDTSLPLIAAGGGGGASGQGYEGRDATVEENGNNSFSTVNGGIAGNGGRNNAIGTSYWAGGGAGWLTDGTAGNTIPDYRYDGGSAWGSAQGGRSPLNGGKGGERWNDGDDDGGDGGFGGGGGGGSDNMGSGGGGGYSGGGGQNGDGTDKSGGGGGSYNSGANQDNVSAFNSGHGYVVITFLCNPLTNSASAGQVYKGEMVDSNDASTNGGTISWDLGITDDDSITLPSGAPTFTVMTIDVNGCLEEDTADITNANEVFVTAIDGATETGFGNTHDWGNDGIVDGTNGIVENGSNIYAVTAINAKLGVAQLEDGSLSVYPNPTVGTVNIELTGQFNYRLNDMSGKLIMKGNGIDKVSLNLVELPSGTYLVHVITENEHKIVRLIKG